MANQMLHHEEENLVCYFHSDICPHTFPRSYFFIIVFLFKKRCFYPLAFYIIMVCLRRFMDECQRHFVYEKCHLENSPL